MPSTTHSPHLGGISIKLRSSIPGDHVQRVERYIQNRATTVLDRMPYALPQMYTLLLHQWVCHSLRHSINSRSAPRTPNSIITGDNPTLRPIPFGRCCMVTVHPTNKLTSLPQPTRTLKMHPRLNLVYAWDFT